ncbi:hypothetical protein [Pistricoccus aurantiacus]|uniref:hypothetical protein n=1 Tax=Pistricoccus aurantiacus TaxID=1883414 RepID=UPI00366FDB26
MGSADLFRNFVGEIQDFPVALSISHGVDFGHCFGVMDIDNIEPIHWSCNQEIHDKASKIKPSIIAPHPWAILAGQGLPEAGRGTLVIGPPPGPENDERLYNLIKDRLIDDVSILIKVRGNYQNSMDFWKSKGITPVTAGGRDEDFYVRLYKLLSKYRAVVGVTFSSALIFAASIGKEVSLINGYCYRFYDVGNYKEKVNFSSSSARRVVKNFLDGSFSDKTELSRYLLGFSYLNESIKIKNHYLEVLNSLKEPFFSNKSYKAINFFKINFAIFSGRHGLIKKNMIELLFHFKSKDISLVELCEICAWTSEISTSIKIKKVQWKKGVTVPGYAVVQYE